MELLEAVNSREKLIREKLGHKISCHDLASCSPCFPILKRQLRYDDFTEEVCFSCLNRMEIESALEVAHEMNHELLKLETKKTLGPKELISTPKKTKGKKREDGLYHMFITFTPDPSKDTNITMVDKAERFAKLSGIKQYLYCFEYMQNVPIVHVHFYLKLDNIKHFGPKEIYEFNKARVDVQHVISPEYVQQYIRKKETKAYDVSSVLQSPNWKD